MTLPHSETRVTATKQAIRERSVAFAARWRGTTSEAADRQTFWNEFFAIFGVDLKEVGFFEALATKVSTGSTGWIDLLVPGVMAVEHKSAGKDLFKAMDQLIDYIDSLSRAEKPVLLVTCNFEEFLWRDLVTRKEGRFRLDDLASHVDLFWSIAGYVSTDDLFEDEEEANLIATGYMAAIHDAVLATGYDTHALREWLTRILFCLFADDTNVWDRALFRRYLYLTTKPDGSDLGRTLAEVFQILDTPPDRRAGNLDDDLASFTYINGDLFDSNLPIPSCDESIRTALLEACAFDWSAISPAIFGSMFQNVMTPAERRHLGAHYTTEENILKTIRPLFLDDLEAELSRATTKPALDAFHDKLASLTFLDPACGCGNFLVIALRELRRLEADLLRRQAGKGRAMPTQTLGLSLLCKVTVEQFYGIEIEEFPARIARTALYLMDHKANLEVSKEFGQYFARFPIPSSPHIVIANALRMDWGDVVSSEQIDYVFGNPPFVGALRLNDDQTWDRTHVFEDMPQAVGLQHGRLDYVVCWYAKACSYLSGQHGRAAFVSTNSISQGEQARSLGPFLSRWGFEIEFAYRTFPWTSEAKGKAVVHCVIVGFCPLSAVRKRKVLFEVAGPHEVATSHSASHINAWLMDAPDVTIEKRSAPFHSGYPKFTVGSQPTDGGGLILEEADAERAAADPIANRYLRRFVGADEMLRGKDRWCLWLVDSSPNERRSSAFLAERLAIVKGLRDRSPTKSFRETPPYLFTHRKQPSDQYLAMPRTSSELRRVIPMALFPAEVIAGDALMIAPGASTWLFSILQSAMFMAWVRTVCGRLKSDIRVSADLAYNAFPMPQLDEEARESLDDVGSRVLRVREGFAESSLADLYDPLSMPSELAKAHDAMDRVVDMLFAPRKRFGSDSDRLKVLFERYKSLADG